MLAALTRINVGGALRARASDRRDGHHARPHHHRRQRARREGRPAAAAATRSCAGSCWPSPACAALVRDLSLAHASGPRSSPRPAPAPARRPRSTTSIDCVHRHFGGPTQAIKDAVTYGLLNPMQSLLAESPWWLAGVAIIALAFVFGGLRALVTDGHLPRRHLVLRPVARRDDHADHDAGRHRAGDGPGRWSSASGWHATGASTWCIRPAPRRRPDDPAVRLPDPGARAVRADPVHRDRRRHRLRRPGRHQAGGRRRQGRLADHDRGRPLHRRRRPGRRSPRSSCRWPRARSCWPPTRACSTCWRWPSSAASSVPARSATTSCSASPAARSGARARRPASPSCCSASCSTGSPAPRPTYRDESAADAAKRTWLAHPHARVGRPSRLSNQTRLHHATRR